MSTNQFLTALNAMCSDGNCIFRPSGMRGMVTNGGCKCSGDYSKRHQLERFIRFLRNQDHETVVTKSPCDGCSCDTMCMAAL